MPIRVVRSLSDSILLIVILAANFDILLGKIKVKVPLVLEDDDYSIVCEYLFDFVASTFRANEHISVW